MGDEARFECYTPADDTLLGSTDTPHPTVPWLR